MPSSLIRRVTAADARPDMMATSMPAARAACIASPSRTSKRLISSPAGPYASRPSVSTPSTSSTRRRIREAFAGAFTVKLEDLGAENVVDVDHADGTAGLVRDHEAGHDAFHERQGPRG